VSLSDLFSQRLREIRRIKKISQQELADRIGTTRVTLNRWEMKHSKTITLEDIDKLGQALGITIGQLLGFESLGLELPSGITQAVPASQSAQGPTQGSGLPLTPGSMNDRRISLIQFALNANEKQLEQLEAAKTLAEFTADADESQIGDTPAAGKRRG
jgi:transcriptional regulator with XRE-family HTH domain